MKEKEFDEGEVKRLCLEITKIENELGQCHTEEDKAESNTDFAADAYNTEHGSYERRVATKGEEIDLFSGIIIRYEEMAGDLTDHMKERVE